jgi:hypothetical protein
MPGPSTGTARAALARRLVLLSNARVLAACAKYPTPNGIGRRSVLRSVSGEGRNFITSTGHVATARVPFRGAAQASRIESYSSLRGIERHPFEDPQLRRAARSVRHPPVDHDIGPAAGRPGIWVEAIEVDQLSIHRREMRLVARHGAPCWSEARHGCRQVLAVRRAKTARERLSGRPVSSGQTLLERQPTARCPVRGREL